MTPETPPMETLQLVHPADLMGLALHHGHSTLAEAVLRSLACRSSLSAEATLKALDVHTTDILHRWSQSISTMSAVAQLSRPQLDYDEHFCIHRVQSANAKQLADIFCEGIVISYARLLQDSLLEPRMDLGSFGYLCATLEGLLLEYVDPSSSSTSIANLTSTVAVTSGVDADPVVRWRRSHHVFFILIQALILAHSRLTLALQAEEIPRAVDALEQASQLWWAAAGAFRYAGGISAQAYTEQIRPLMQPPHVNEGFSGLHSADHSYLFRLLHGMRSQMSQLPPPVARRHPKYLWGLQSMYESHAYVCERFVANGSSLHGIRGPNKNEPRSGVDELRGTFKQRAIDKGMGSFGR